MATLSFAPGQECLQALAAAATAAMDGFQGQNIRQAPCVALACQRAVLAPPLTRRWLGTELVLLHAAAAAGALSGLRLGRGCCLDLSA